MTVSWIDNAVGSSSNVGMTLFFSGSLTGLQPQIDNCVVVLDKKKSPHVGLSFIFPRFIALHLWRYIFTSKWTPHTDNRVQPNKSKITSYENMYFNSVVIIILINLVIYNAKLNYIWLLFCIIIGNERSIMHCVSGMLLSYLQTILELLPFSSKTSQQLIFIWRTIWRYHIAHNTQFQIDNNIQDLS